MESFKEFEFETAHRLSSLPEGHQCSRLHGYSFQLELYVEGPVDEALVRAIDFSDVKQAFKLFFALLDHNYLNGIQGLENPTSENISRWNWNQVKPRLRQVVTRVTCTSSCVYLGDSESREAVGL